MWGALNGWQQVLFPVAAMSVVFRAKMLAALDSLYAQGGFVRFEDFNDPEAFGRLMCRVARKTWVVYAKKPFRKVGHVLRYLGRYTHRVAIANSRLVDVTDNTVSFRTKEGKVTTLKPVEFLRRFLQHVLPDRFHKIRHYGLYAASAAKEQLDVARQQLAPGRSAQAVSARSSACVPVSWIEQLRTLTGRDVTRCPCCEGVLVTVPLPRQQAPPLPRTA
jgi:hypothetical protein